MLPWLWGPCVLYCSLILLLLKTQQLYHFSEIRIGFQLTQYDYFEPDLTPVTYRNVTLVKEDNRVSEQTFGIQIIFGDPGQGINAATLQQVGQSAGYDYVIDIPGSNRLNVVFHPNQSELSVQFSLQPDDLFEGIEGFKAVISTQGTPYPNFQLPAGTSAFSETIIRIIDTTESKFLYELSLWMMNVAIR